MNRRPPGDEIPLLPRGGRRYDSDRLVVTPAPAGTAPPVSAEEAIASGRAKGRTGADLGPPDVELMIANGGGLVDQDHPTTRGGFALKNRLVWVLTWRDVDGVIRGPRMSVQRRDEIRRRTLFVDIAIVDATSAAVLYSKRHGERRPE